VKGKMPVDAHRRRRAKAAARAGLLLGSLLLTLTLGLPARAVSSVTVDGYPKPPTVVEDERVVFHFDGTSLPRSARWVGAGAPGRCWFPGPTGRAPRLGDEGLLPARPGGG